LNLRENIWYCDEGRRKHIMGFLETYNCDEICTNAGVCLLVGYVERKQVASIEDVIFNVDVRIIIK
jgi:hypothetical protein